MPYAVIMRFDSLREIKIALTAEVRNLHHIGIGTIPNRSTLSDANARHNEKFFDDVYHYLYEANKKQLTSDSRQDGVANWIKQLQIIDSATISLFSNAIFKGVGHHPKTGKKGVMNGIQRAGDDVSQRRHQTQDSNHHLR